MSDTLDFDTLSRYINEEHVRLDSSNIAIAGHYIDADNLEAARHPHPRLLLPTVLSHATQPHPANWAIAEKLYPQDKNQRRKACRLLELPTALQPVFTRKKTRTIPDHIRMENPRRFGPKHHWPWRKWYLCSLPTFDSPRTKMRYPITQRGDLYQQNMGGHTCSPWRKAFQFDAKRT